VGCIQFDSGFPDCDTPGDPAQAEKMEPVLSAEHVIKEHGLRSGDLGQKEHNFGILFRLPREKRKPEKYYTLLKLIGITTSGEGHRMGLGAIVNNHISADGI
jgi:hypothetical protein